MTGSGKDSSEGWGGCLLIVAIATIGGFVKTWPWPLLILPAVVTVALATSPRFRASTRLAFREGPANIDEKVDRGRLQTASLWLAAAYLPLCALTLPWQSLQWWLIPISFAAVGCRLWALSRESTRGSHLTRAIAEHTSELLTICAIVLAIYTLLLGWFRTWPIDEWTLGYLKHLEERIRSVHEAVERYRPHAWTLLLIVLAIYAVGLLGCLYQHLSRVSPVISSGLAGGVRWSARFATAAAVAASLTYLATEANGPLAPISISLRDGKQAYEDFHRTLSDRIDGLLRDALLQKVWVERPPAVVAEMHRSVQFIEARRKYEHAAAEATNRYGIRSEALADVPESMAAEPRHVPDKPNEGSDEDLWTPRSLNQAKLDVARWPTADLKDDLPKTDDPEEATAKETFAEMVPADRLFAAVPVIEAVRLHYPVFGELLDVVKHSISDALFDSIHSRVVRRVAETRRTNVASDFDFNARAEVTAVLPPLSFDWRRYDAEWTIRTRETLERYVLSLNVAYAQVQAKADATQRAWIAKLIVVLKTRAAELRSALQVQSPSDESSVAAVEDAVAKLMSLAEQWPALGEPTSDLVARMRELLWDQQRSIPDLAIVIQTSVDDSRSAQEYRYVNPVEEMLLKARMAAEELRDPQHSLIRVMPPYAALVELRTYCVERTTELVGKAPEFSPESAHLRELLGKRYEDYRDRWTKISAERAQKKIEEARQQAEQDRLRREYEASREVRVP